MRGFNPDFPDELARILLGTPDLAAVSVTYAGEQSPIAVGAAGESKMSPLHPVQVSELLR
jgi:hypothetical protein